MCISVMCLRPSLFLLFLIFKFSLSLSLSLIIREVSVRLSRPSLYTRNTLWVEQWAWEEEQERREDKKGTGDMIDEENGGGGGGVKGRGRDDSDATWHKPHSNNREEKARATLITYCIRTLSGRRRRLVFRVSRGFAVVFGAVNVSSQWAGFVSFR